MTNGISGLDKLTLFWVLKSNLLRYVKEYSTLLLTIPFCVWDSSEIFFHFKKLKTFDTHLILQQSDLPVAWHLTCILAQQVSNLLHFCPLTRWTNPCQSISKLYKLLPYLRNSCLISLKTTISLGTIWPLCKGWPKPPPSSTQHVLPAKSCDTVFTFSTNWESNHWKPTDLSITML